MTPTRSLPRAVLVLSAAAWLAAGASVSAAPRYLVRLVDGTETVGQDLRDWYKPEAEPKLDGQPLFRAERPVRWIQSGVGPSERPRSAFVELVGGDCLPGTVIGFGSGSGSAFQSHPPHVEVVPGTAVSAPQQDPGTPVRVVLRWVRRIVWDGAGAGRGAEPPPPGTVRLRDGRAWRFRSVRWGPDGATVLHEGGITRCAWHDLAEIHLPETDPWDDHLDLLAMLSPDLQARVVQCEADDGLRVTASTVRFQPRSFGDVQKTTGWYHLLHPAWSLDALWLRFDAVRIWRWFEPHEVPLTVFPAIPVRIGSPFGIRRGVRLDRSAAGTPLRVGETSAGWGLGTHAPQSLECPVPLLEKEFRVRVGLDQVAGPLVGCALGAVTFGRPNASPAYRTPILRGSSTVADSGWLKVPNLAPDARRVYLTADAEPRPRPTGADPLDIRDFVDWLEPEWRLDRDKLAAEVARRVLVGIPALAGWTPAESDRTRVQVAPVWDATGPSAIDCVTTLRWSSPFATFERDLDIDRNDRYLAVTVARRPVDPTKTGALQPLALQVRIDGRAWAEFAVRAAERNRAPEPVYVSVVPFQGRTVRVELVPMGDEQPASKEQAACLEWIGLGLIDRQPGLLTIFEDDPRFARELGDGKGRADVVHEDSYVGAAAVVVEGPARGSPRLSGLQAAIRERPQADEYRYLRFAWRKTGGGKIGLRLAHDGVFGRDQPGLRRDRDEDLRGSVPIGAQERGLQYGFAYDAGPGDALHGASLRLDGQTPVRWGVVTRDLYSDFGRFRLTGLQFTGDEEGGAAWFDHIHLARRVEDFASLTPGSSASRSGLFGPDPSDPNLLQRAYESGEFGPIVSRLGTRFTLDPTSWDGVCLTGTLFGRENVVRTMPIDATRPSVFRAPLEVPAGKKTVLVLGTGHDGHAPWKLLVRAAGETLHEGLVSTETNKEKWKDLEIDLSRFAGRRVLVEVQQHAHGGNLRPAYWSRMDVVDPSAR